MRLSLGWAGRAIPRQQFRDAIDFVIRDAGEDVNEIADFLTVSERVAMTLGGKRRKRTRPGFGTFGWNVRLMKISPN